MPHLLRSQADTLGRMHGFNHVCNQLLDLRRDPFDVPAFLSEHRMTIFNNGQYHVKSRQTKSQPHRATMSSSGVTGRRVHLAWEARATGHWNASVRSGHAESPMA